MGLMYSFSQERAKIIIRKQNYNDTSHCVPFVECLTSAGLCDGALDIDHLIGLPQWPCGCYLYYPRSQSHTLKARCITKALPRKSAQFFSLPLHR